MQKVDFEKALERILKPIERKPQCPFCGSENCDAKHDKYCYNCHRNI